MNVKSRFIKILKKYSIFKKGKMSNADEIIGLDLPYEIVLHIFSFLDLPDICKCRLVSRDFLKIASEYSLWKVFVLKLKTEKKPAPRVCHTAVVYNNLMYIYGGHLPDNHTFIMDVKSDIHEYSFEKRLWKKRTPTGKPMPPKTEHTSVIYKESMYIFGGYSPGRGQSYFDVSIYKLNLETFEGVSIEGNGNIPSGRSAHCATVWKNYMYVFGGWDGTESNNSFYRFDFNTEAWEEVPAKGTPPPCIRSHSCVLVDNFLYIVGGYGPNGHTEFPYSYDLVNDVWIPMDSIRDGPSGRSRFRTVVYGNYLWCLGGWDRSNYYNDLWRFNLEERTWRKMYSNFDLNGIGQYSLVTYKNQIYIYGGYNPSTSQPQPNLYTYMVGNPSEADNEVMALEKIYDEDNDEQMTRQIEGFSCSNDGCSVSTIDYDLEVSSSQLTKKKKTGGKAHDGQTQNGSFFGIPTN